MVPASMSPEARKRAAQDIREGMKEIDDRYTCAIHVDNDYSD